ncbi:MAG: hypothetical protein R3Y29_01750 [bacterium]
MNKTNIPLKKEIPYLKYDFSRYCAKLKEGFIVELPEYLRSFNESLNYNISQLSKNIPKEPPSGYRIYIIDYRLNILFATIDPTGKIPTFCLAYSKQYHDITDYLFGNGRTGKIPISYIECDEFQLDKFKNTFGYLPIEELCTNFVAIFDAENLTELRYLTPYQTQFLLEKYKTKNYIDWKQIVKNTIVDPVIIQEF